MSSLEASVLLLAAIAIVVVGLYNLWLFRARGAGRRAAARGKAAGNAHEDASGGEPSLGDPPASAVGGFPSLAGDAALELQRSGTAILDARVDCILEWRLSSDAAGERLTQWIQGQRRVGGKPIVIEAAEAMDVSADTQTPSAGMTAPRWEPPAAGRRYGHVRIGVLLANRHGPLNAMEFTEFVSTVQALADQLSVLPDTPDMSAVLARARELDQACEQLDAQVGLGIEAGEVLGTGDLARLAAEFGCEERGNNRHVRLTEHGQQLFSLALADAPNRLSLMLDVPRAPSACDPWNQMVACAQVCAQRLDGALTDDTGRVLTQPQLDRIGQLITQRQRDLEAAGLAPGTSLALRVFN